MKFFDNKYIKTILPLILAAITGITGNAIFSVKDGMLIFCIITLILSLFFEIVLAIRYVKVDTEKDAEIERLTTENKDCNTQITSLEKHVEGYNTVFVDFSKCFNNGADNIYKLIKHARNTNLLDFNIWNYSQTCEYVCESLFNLISHLAEFGQNFSVNVVVPELKGNKRKNKVFTMLAYDGYNKTKPHMYKKDIPQKDAFNYYYGKLFKKGKADVTYLMSKEEINTKFFFKDDANKGKYSQYIGIPIYCNGVDMVGLLQIVAHNDSVITNDEKIMKDIANNIGVAYSNLILFAEKTQKAIEL